MYVPDADGEGERAAIDDVLSSPASLSLSLSAFPTQVLG